jgi:tetrahydromethanopterin S-methyltransferase subunit H
MSDAEHEDWLLRFLYEFASMSEEERDAAIDALSPADREALVVLADVRAVTAEADLVEILDAGQSGLDKLYELTQPADLFAVITLAVREHPNIAVEALFAAVVLHRAWDEQEPAAIVALREAWHWHVHEQIGAARREDADRGAGA